MTEFSSLARAVPFCALISAAALGQTPRQFETVGDGEVAISSGPLASQPLTVVLQLAGDAVAVVRSRAVSRRISEAQRASIEDDLSRQQEALVPAIEAMGGAVLAKYQHALNGIKVSATPDGILAMSRLPGVIGVKPVLTYEMTNATSVPFIGAPSVWGTAGTGFRGEGVKIAIVDTGIDYTHANFAGPGTPAAFKAAFAHNTEPADPALFGPGAPKVKGGIDLVGDDYNASAPAGDPRLVPHPDPNPLDCNGHGSHVAGTAAGFGIRPDGTTFHGPYASSTPAAQKFRIGPGVAPGADLYAVRVFGCEGSTNVVVEAIDWAVRNGMDVISMSLGANFGPSDSADAEASSRAVEAGVIVVAAAGNAGPTAYFTGSPASGDKVLSVAAMDSNSPPSFPAVNIALNTGKVVKAQNSNAVSALPSGSLAIFLMPNDGVEGGLPFSGCDEKKWAANAAGLKGKLVVTRRGSCARVDRAILGQKYGAAAVAMVNTSAAYPPFEGSIGGVTIPFLGVRGPNTPDRLDLIAAATGSLSTASPIVNPDFHAFASFSSGGPRSHDSHLKPDITAPGVNVVSSLIGSGNGGAAFSGTSMATPHVSGVAALALQSHPGWEPQDVALSVANTGIPSGVVGYRVQRGGSGLVQPFPATRTQVVARGPDETGSLSFGLAEFTSDFAGTEELKVKNLGETAQTFTASFTRSTGSPHSVSISPSTFRLEAGDDQEVRVTLTVPAATSGGTSGSEGVFREVSGFISLVPIAADGNNGVELTVPYYLVPRARSAIRTSLQEDFGPGGQVAGSALIRNASPAVAGSADFYAWGLGGKNRGLGTAGLRGVGVQSLDLRTGGTCSAGSDCLLVFAVNTFGRWTTPVRNEFDILVDADNDGKFDFVVATVGFTSGRVGVFVFDFNTGKQLAQKRAFFAVAPTNESTVLMPVLAGDLKIASTNPRFTYGAQGFDGFTGNFDFLGETTTGAVGPDAASFNAFTNALSTGAFVSVPPLGSANVALSIDPAEFRLTPALGIMSVAIDNVSGAKEADLLRFGDGEHEGT